MINKNPEEMTEQEKIMLAIEGTREFFDTFDGPNDIYKQIFLEVLFSELMGANIDEPED